MDIFNLYEHFITVAEQEEIIAWALSIKENLSNRESLHSGGGGRRLCRVIGDFSRPALIDELQTRIETALKFDENEHTRLRYKIVIHEKGADTQNHVDQYSMEDYEVVRAALLVQEATQGGIFHVDNTPVKFPELSLLNFVGISAHGVSQVDNGERILLRSNWHH